MRHRGFVRGVVVALTAVVCLATAALADGDGTEYVLSPEGNHLWAYDAATGDELLVIQGQNAGDPGVEPVATTARRDINGQICVSPDGAHFIAGEDTVIGSAGEGDGGSSHDPRIAGWGWFSITGASADDLRVEQVGKLAPEGAGGPGYAGDPDNYGCGFLDGARLFTTAIGDILPGQPANGQLFLWFGPFEAGYQELTDGGVTFFVGDVPHCEIDATLATAGGIAVAPDGGVYVATNRPDDAGNPGGVWRYEADWPTSPDGCVDGRVPDVTKTLVVPPVPVFANPISPTPSAVVISPDDTLYVSSVFSGTVSEYTLGGVPIRDIFPTSPVAVRTGPTGDTPFGLTFTSDGTLWIADLGIVGGAPVSGEGSLVRVAFSGGQPTPFGETVRDGLTFPDGLGVYVGRAASGSPPEPEPAPDPTSLPATGGGIALAGLLLILAGRWLGSTGRHRA